MKLWNIFLLMLLTFHLKINLAKEIELNYNPKIFDDQYKGCRMRMNTNIPRILKNEMKSSVAFKSGWLKAKTHWRKIKSNMSDLPKGFRDEHGIALVAYSGSLYSAFNNATRKVGDSVRHYKKKFSFKAMHYYLTMAVKMLSNKYKKVVYRGVSNIHFIPSNHSHGFIRFGQFTSSSEDRAVATKFGTSSFFTMQTRLGVEIQRFSQYPNEKEVLIPGYEMFKVVSFNRKTHSFKLTSKGLSKSRFNCAYFKAFNG
ncbi:ecto-ADP-ribosyltransferase 5-like [Dendropsophus ebraccatus]|uniref:ecto-ADP-ribosyltransferase 5-like n=1 Tax=Dendropsophus ebraccatus TaxID=150705 RepID=UPI003831FA8A